MLTAPPKTPGVYIDEKNAFPNSVVQVATAVPAFIGYTEKAELKGKQLLNTPTRITSIAEYENAFGKGPKMKFKIAAVGAAAKKPAGGAETDKPNPDNAQSNTSPTAPPDFMADGSSYTLTSTDVGFSLYNSMRLFFQNGGGACYIVSVGIYKDSTSIDKSKLSDGVKTLLKEQEPTLIVIPEAVRLTKIDDCISLQQEVLAHCAKMQSRMGILDIYAGSNDLIGAPTPVDNFRDKLGVDNLKYGAAYYPWLNTTIVQSNEIDYTWLDLSADGDVSLVSLLKADVANTLKDQKLKAAEGLIDKVTTVPGAETGKEKKLEDGKTDASKDPKKETEILHQTLLVISPLFNSIMDALRAKLNLLPPAAAMAGVYTRVDNARGVWKAPANVSLASVVSPTVNISHDEQEDLNVPLQGKAVNAIRPFIGEGILVWGARTLDGNSQDWRYINVRRTMIMLEQSIKIATKAYVFEPNDANTWVGVKSMINNFLTGQWKAGALVGAKPEDAFDVQVGLGSTMTADDILNGMMNITVKVAISHPAEFIVITFQQQQQKS